MRALIAAIEWLWFVSDNSSDRHARLGAVDHAKALAGVAAAFDFKANLTEEVARWKDRHTALALEAMRDGELMSHALSVLQAADFALETDKNVAGARLSIKSIIADLEASLTGEPPRSPDTAKEAG